MKIKLNLKLTTVYSTNEILKFYDETLEDLSDDYSAIYLDNNTFNKITNILKKINIFIDNDYIYGTSYYERYKITKEINICKDILY